MTESLSSVYWSNQLVQLLRGPVTRLSLRLAVKLLATALDRSRDLVQITDSENNVGPYHDLLVFCRKSGNKPATCNVRKGWGPEPLHANVGEKLFYFISTSS